MNPLTLEFEDRNLESQFQISTQTNLHKQFLKLIISFISIAVVSIIIELTKANFVLVGIYSIYILTYSGAYYFINKNRNLALKSLKFFNKAIFFVPAIDILFTYFQLIQVPEQIAFIITMQIYAPLIHSSYNIIYDLVSILITVGTNVYHISLIVGPTPYYSVILCGLILLIMQRYFQVKLERSQFSQSLVNQSLVDVITKVCKENIIIFTYNLEQHKYEKEIINETAQFYFNTDILSDILKEIHIKSQREDIDIQSFVFKNYIQQQKRGEFELQGYYKSKTKKIQIKLYVTQYLNIQIILKIEKQELKIIKIRKAKKLINFQLCFLQTLLKKFSECFRIQEGIDIPQFKFYNYLHKSIIYNKLQILSMVTCPQIIIQTINLEQMIVNVFGAWNLKYFLKTKYHEIPETSRQIQDYDGSVMNTSKIHIELLLQVVAIVLRKVILNYQEFILIELEYSQDIILLNFNFNSKNYIQKIGYLKENLAKLICLLGIKESYQFQENTISFKILKQLNEFG